MYTYVRHKNDFVRHLILQLRECERYTKERLRDGIFNIVHQTFHCSECNFRGIRIGVAAVHQWIGRRTANEKLISRLILDQRSPSYRAFRHRNKKANNNVRVPRTRRYMLVTRLGNIKSVPLHFAYSETALVTASRNVQ